MTPSHVDDDATWAAAREASRAEVQAALAPRQRTCPHCGRTATSPGPTCPSCGGPFVVRRGRRPSAMAVAIAVAALVSIGAVSAALVPALRESAGREQRAAADRQARLEAAERARLRAEGRPSNVSGPVRRRGEAPLAHRSRLVTAGEAAITADARRRVEAGTVDGPVLGTQCTPFPSTETRRRLETDAAVPRGRYQCLAYETRFELPELEGRTRTGLLGVPYWLVVDYRQARMTFCKVTPRAGEGGRSLAVVPVPVACRDPLRAS